MSVPRLYAFSTTPVCGPALQERGVRAYVIDALPEGARILTVTLRKEQIAPRVWAIADASAPSKDRGLFLASDGAYIKTGWIFHCVMEDGRSLAFTEAP